MPRHRPVTALTCCGAGTFLLAEKSVEKSCLKMKPILWHGVASLGRLATCPRGMSMAKSSMSDKAESKHECD